MSLNQYPNLIELSDFQFPVYASAGTEQQAQSIAARCRNAHEFLGSVFEFEPQMNVLVLAPEHWDEYANFPVYGMPHYTDERTLAVAGQDNGFWQSMTPPVEVLPPEAAQAMKAAYGQPDGSINLSPFFDLLTVHELGHLFQFQAKCQFPRLWLAELFCNICLHAYVVAREPEQLPALETFPQMVANLGVAELRYRSLKDFERLYTDVGAPAWSNDVGKIYFYKAEAAVADDRIGGLCEFDLKTSKINVLTDASKFVSSLTLTTAGKLLYAESPSSAADPRLRETGAHEGAYLVRRNADGGDKQILTDDKHDYSHPRANSKNQIVAHGKGSLEGLQLMSSGVVFSRAETFKDVSLSGRKVFVAGVRAYAPSVSADGKEIFTTEWIGDENEKLWGFSPVISSDLMGNNYRTVFKPDKCFAWTPIVSPDKQWLIYACGARFAESNQKVDIWRVKLDGSEALNLTENLQGNSAFPDLSSDGKRIVFRGGHDGNKEIYLMDFDGKNLRRMTNTPQTETMPVISPDGKHIAYARENPETHNMNIYLQTVDNPNDTGKPLEPERLNLFSADVHPRFSPDGKWIVFVSSRALTKDEWTSSGFHPQPDGEIFAKRIGSDEPAVQLTDDKWEDGITPYWGFIETGRK